MNGWADLVDERFLDVVLAGVALETVALVFWLRVRAAGAWIGPLVLYLASGAALLATLRLALAGVRGPGLAAGLALALATHVAFLLRGRALVERSRRLPRG